MATERPPEGQASAVAPLRYSDFRSVWFATMFSNIGTFLQSVAGAWLMLELTGSATWVGMMVGATLLPTFIFGVIAGALADILDRTKVMAASNLLSAIAAGLMATFTILDRITPGVLLGLGFLLGTGVAFMLPSWQSFVPDLVPRSMVASAVALNSAAFNVARAVGPALGGLLLATAGAGAAFALNAVSYVAIIIVLIRVGRRIEVAGDPDAGSLTGAISVGIRYTRFNAPFRRILYLAAMYAIASSAVQAIMPTHTEELGGSETTFGILLGSMGFGALIGAFIRPRVVRILGKRMVGFTIISFGLATIGLGLAPNVPLAVVALLFVGIMWVLTLTRLNATAQLMAPAWVRGRAMSLFTLAFVGILPMGSFIAGAVADNITAANTNVLFGAIAVGVGLLVPLLNIPVLEEVVTPDFTEEDPRGQAHDAFLHEEQIGGPIMVINTYVVDHDSLDQFLEVSEELRVVRLQTGAYRWRLFRNAAEPHRLTELFLCHSWEEHLAQHHRTDDAALAVIKRAMALDINGAPSNHHLIAVDTTDPHGWEELMASHDRYHETAGTPSNTVERPR